MANTIGITDNTKKLQEIGDYISRESKIAATAEVKYLRLLADDNGTLHEDTIKEYKQAAKDQEFRHKIFEEVYKYIFKEAGQ